MHLVAVQCDTHAGFGKMSGLLRFDGARLCLQHQTRDSLFGVLRSQPCESEIPLEKLVEFRYSWFAWWSWRPSFELMLGDLRDASSIPGADGNRIRYSVRWSDRHSARKLADALHASLAELRFRRFNEEIDQMTGSAAADAPRTRTATGNAHPQRSAANVRPAQSE